MKTREQAGSAREQRSRSLNDQAVRFHLQQDLGSARATYEAAVQANPKNASARNNLGFLLAQIGELKEATRQLRRAVKLQPEDASARVNLGQVLAAQGRTRDGLVELQLAVDMAPGNPRGWDNLGRVQLMSGDPAGAERSWRRGLESDPADPAIATRLATVLSLQGHYDEAAELLRQTTRQSPAYADAWTQLGVVLYIQRELATARKVLQRALGLNRRDATALRHLALVELACGNREAALRVYNEVMDVDPSRQGDAIDRAVLLLSMGEADAAYAQLDELQERGVDEALFERLQFYLALALWELGRDEQARPLMRSLAEAGGEYAQRAQEQLAGQKQGGNKS